MRSLLSSLLFLTLLVLGLPAADVAKFHTPEPKEMAEDLRKPGPHDKDYPLPFDAAQAKKQFNETRTWYRKQFVEPFTAVDHTGVKWAEKAKAALDSCAIYYSAERSINRRDIYFQNAAVKLREALAAGCDDPVVQVFAARLLTLYQTPTQKSEGFGKSLEALEKIKAPAYIRAEISLHHSFQTFLIAKRAGTPKGKGKKAFETTLRYLAELSKDPHPAAQDAMRNIAKYVLINYEDAGWGREAGFLDLNEVLTDAGAPPALINTLKGEFLVTYAWDARGNGRANSVTEDGQANFSARLGQAQVAFEAAWAADETQDAAAAGMISVCMGLGLPRETMELWFTRAMKANPNSYRACSLKLTYLLPKWHGTEEDCLYFGRQCLRTKNFIAGVPYMLVQAHRSLGPANMLKFSEYLSENPQAWADIREYYESALQSWTSDRQLLTEYAVWCTGTGHWTQAKKFVNMLNGQPFNGIFATPKDYAIFVQKVNENQPAKAKK